MLRVEHYNRPLRAGFANRRGKRERNFRLLKHTQTHQKNKRILIRGEATKTCHMVPVGVLERVDILFDSQRNSGERKTLPYVGSVRGRVAKGGSFSRSGYFQGENALLLIWRKQLTTRGKRRYAPEIKGVLALPTSVLFGGGRLYHSRKGLLSVRHEVLTIKRGRQT